MKAAKTCRADVTWMWKSERLSRCVCFIVLCTVGKAKFPNNHQINDNFNTYNSFILLCYSSQYLFIVKPRQVLTWPQPLNCLFHLLQVAEMFLVIWSDSFLRCFLNIFVPIYFLQVVQVISIFLYKNVLKMDMLAQLFPPTLISKHPYAFKSNVF